MAPKGEPRSILLAISTTRESPAAIERALEEAAKHASTLIALFVVDHGIPDSIGRLLITTGYLGEKPSQRLAEAILDEYRERGESRLDAIREAATQRGIDCHVLLREGEFAEECLRAIVEKDVQKVLLTRAKRSGISRFLFGSAVNRVREEAPCPVEIVSEK